MNNDPLIRDFVTLNKSYTIYQGVHITYFTSALFAMSQLVHWDSLLKPPQLWSFSQAHSASPRRAGKSLITYVCPQNYRTKHNPLRVVKRVPHIKDRLQNIAGIGVVSYDLTPIMWVMLFVHTSKLANIQKSDTIPPPLHF